MSALAVPSSPAAIKKLEKQFSKEAKREDAQVKQALKDVQSTEKHKAKTQKAAVKADQTIEKITKAETATLKPSTKPPTTTTPSSSTCATQSGTPRRVKHQEDERLEAELEAKKARAAEVLQAQLAHAEERKTKILELREKAGIATPESTPRNSDASSGASHTMPDGA
ncbi:hypothetical protein B0H13DRAFT_2649251 [Mycena leptocephala]|nr:hypothetical protein B0H13DRAFT_2649251 [Mycena leptocephala]